MQASAGFVSSKLGGGGRDNSTPTGSELNGAGTSPHRQPPSLSSSDTIALIEGAYQQQPQLQSPDSRDGELASPV
jgi:hypothetical protein